MKSFLEKYIEQLIKYCKVPKFQNERAVSIILSLYLEYILFELYKEKYIFVTIELPIVKKDTHLTTNIDYVMVSEDLKKALLIELKTESQGFDVHFRNQIKEYADLKNVKSLHQAFENVVGFKRKKAHNSKYLKQQLIIGDYLKNIEVIQIMYIAPDNMVANELNHKECSIADYKISFSDLMSITIDDDWEIIKKYLSVLNKNT